MTSHGSPRAWTFDVARRRWCHGALVGGSPVNERGLLWILVEFIARAGDLGVAVIAEGFGSARLFVHIRGLGTQRSRGRYHSVAVHDERLASLLRAGPAPSGRFGFWSAVVAGTLA